MPPTTTTRNPETPLAVELHDMAAWLDDLAAAFEDRGGTKYSGAELRAWNRAQAARARGHAFLARMALGVTPGQVNAKAAPIDTVADHIAGGCEFCPMGGGGCPVCRGS